MSTIARRALCLSLFALLAGCAADVGSAELESSEIQHVEVMFLPSTSTDARALERAGFAIEAPPAGLERAAPPRAASVRDGRGQAVAGDLLHPGEALGISGIIVMRTADGAVELPSGSLELITPEGPLPILDVETATYPSMNGWRVGGLSRLDVESAAYPSFNGWRVAGCDPDPWALSGETLAGVLPARFAIDGVPVDGVAVLVADGEPVGVVGRPALGEGSIGIMPYAELVVGSW